MASRKADRGPEVYLHLRVNLLRSASDGYAAVEVSADGYRGNLGYHPDPGTWTEGLPEKVRIKIKPDEDGSRAYASLCALLRRYIELVAPIDDRTSWEIDE